ncbi:hypothetical protein RP20_CCG012330 [Aedes albopictus]|nr:hypothetical protein RP20_CCG012330 [Aedes albopictus]
MLRKLIWLFLPFATAVAVHYECLPYPVKSMCRIEYMSYHPGDQISFPAGYQRYHINLPKSMRKAISNVTIFDQQLYEAMHRPTGVEMISAGLKELSLPTELLLGDFNDNHIDTVNTTSGENFHITYLDLSFNSIRNMEFVSPLVNLEILHLGHNFIEVIPDSALSTLTKLKYLYLQHNHYITLIPWGHIPRSIIHLDFYGDNIIEVVLTNISFPSLEYLNVRNNALTTFKVIELLRAAPNLKEAHLHNSDIDEELMRKIYAELTENNVSFKTLYESCESDEDGIWRHMVYGSCTKWHQEVLPMEFPLRSVLLLVVVVGTVIAFVCIVLLVFKHMNR